MRTHEPPRVLHVLRALDRGGVEKWLLDVLRNTPADAWRTEFLVHTTDPGAYDATAVALGAALHQGPDTNRPLRYVTRLQRLLHDLGPFDVVHSHTHFYSGLVLCAADRAGVAVRIAQSHTNMPGPGGTVRCVYNGLMRRMIDRHATQRVAVSEQAATALFGATHHGPHVELLPCGLDFSRYADLAPRAALKQRLGIGDRTIVIGHVGRFDPVKNHEFLMDTFVALLGSGLDAHLLLVGTGALQPAIERRAAELGVSEQCTFTGGHDDVSELIGAMDLMVFPSLYEGFGLAPLEAQAAGVPVLASTAIPAEAEVVRGLLHRRELADGPDAWAAAAQTILETNLTPDRAQCARSLQDSRFGATQSVEHLARLYRLT